MKIEKVSKTVSSAIEEFLSEYNLTFSDIEYQVIQNPSKGFFGLFKKPAKVSFTIKNEKNIKDEISSTSKSSTIQEIKNGIYNEDFNFNNDNLENFYQEDNFKNIDLDFKEKSQKDFINNVPEVARKFLSELFNSMDLNIDFQIEFSGKNLKVFIDGKDVGVIIGKRGQTLYSLQYILNLVINKNSSEYINVNIENVGYTEKRKLALEKLADNLVKKVNKTNKFVKLEPMNSYERKVIHTFLKNNPYVKSFSEGKDPNRCVIIVPKK